MGPSADVKPFRRRGLGATQFYQRGSWGSRREPSPSWRRTEPWVGSVSEMNLVTDIHQRHAFEVWLG